MSIDDIPADELVTLTASMDTAIGKVARLRIIILIAHYATTRIEDRCE